MQELVQSHASVPSIEELTITLRELAPQGAKHGTLGFMRSNGQALWADASPTSAASSGGTPPSRRTYRLEPGDRLRGARHAGRPGCDGRDHAADPQ